MLNDVALILFVVLGVFFMIVAAFGMLRLGDFYERIHAPTKAATLGLLFLLAAATLALSEDGVFPKSILAIFFFAITAPVGAHLLCRAAYRKGLRPKAKSQKSAPG